MVTSSFHYITFVGLSNPIKAVFSTRTPQGEYVMFGFPLLLTIGLFALVLVGMRYGKSNDVLEFLTEDGNPLVPIGRLQWTRHEPDVFDKFFSFVGSLVNIVVIGCILAMSISPVMEEEHASSQRDPLPEPVKKVRGTGPREA